MDWMNRLLLAAAVLMTAAACAPKDPAAPEVIDEGALYDEQLELLKDYALRPWHNEKAKAGESSWEFKLYDENEAVIRHREPGYIQGMDPFDAIAAMLLEELPEE